MKTILATATAAVALSGAPAAQAAEAAVPTCRAAYIGWQYVASVCFEVDAGLSGTTVAPTLYFNGCAYDPAICNTEQSISIGTTGYSGRTAITAPRVDPESGGVRWNGGYLGTVWIDGVERDVWVDGFCVGTPTFCA